MIPSNRCNEQGQSIQMNGSLGNSEYPPTLQQAQGPLYTSFLKIIISRSHYVCIEHSQMLVCIRGYKLSLRPTDNTNQGKLYPALPLSDILLQECPCQTMDAVASFMQSATHIYQVAQD